MGVCGIPEIPLQQGNAVWVEFLGFLEISGNFMAVLRKCCGDFEKEFRYPLKNFRGTGILTKSWKYFRSPLKNLLGTENSGNMEGKSGSPLKNFPGTGNSGEPENRELMEAPGSPENRGVKSENGK